MCSALTVLQLWFALTDSHLVGVGGGLLVVALAVASVLTVASLLAVLWLVASLGPGVGVLLTVGVGSGLLLLRGHVRPGEGSHPAGFLEHKPKIPDPQDHVDESKSLWRRQPTERYGLA